MYLFFLCVPDDHQHQNDVKEYAEKIEEKQFRSYGKNIRKRIQIGSYTYLIHNFLYINCSSCEEKYKIGLLIKENNFISVILLLYDNLVIIKK